MMVDAIDGAAAKVIILYLEPF